MRHVIRVRFDNVLQDVLKYLDATHFLNFFSEISKKAKYIS